MENISLVSDLTWIPRGVARLEPIKLQLEKAQLADLIQGGADEGNTDEEQEEMEDEKPGDDNMDDYDKEDKTGNMMKGVAVYADPKDDPLMTKYEDSEDEAERDDFLLKPNDNLVVVAKIFHDEPTLDVHVFNKDNEDWYVHHSYFLASPPLCVAPIRYDPGHENGKGNLVAVGSFEPTIDIWDIDVYNALEPIMVLGKQAKKSKPGSRKKRDGSAQGHSDAVTCLDWNKNCEHVLASGSADNTVVLWDLDETKPSTIVTCFDDKLGSLKWHETEASIFLAGTKSGKVQIVDCRNTTPSIEVLWDLKAEVEKVIWDHHNQFCILATTDDGKLHYLDSRQPGTSLVSVVAHEGGCNAVAQNFGVKGMVSTIGENELKIWKLCSEKPSLTEVHNYEVKMGKLFTVAFNPDVHNTLVVGGEKEEMIRLFDLEKCSEVRTAFGAVFEDAPMAED